MQPPELKPA